MIGSIDSRAAHMDKARNACFLAASEDALRRQGIDFIQFRCPPRVLRSSAIEDSVTSSHLLDEPLWAADVSFHYPDIFFPGAENWSGMLRWPKVNTNHSVAFRNQFPDKTSPEPSTCTGHERIHGFPFGLPARRNSFLNVREMMPGESAAAYAKILLLREV